jgi:hypothetical protein
MDISRRPYSVTTGVDKSDCAVLALVPLHSHFAKARASTPPSSLKACKRANRPPLPTQFHIITPFRTSAHYITIAIDQFSIKSTDLVDARSCPEI